jgi:hypothetical protein
MSFYATMDRPRVTLVFTCFTVISVAVGCGGPGSTAIDGPGAHPSTDKGTASGAGDDGGAPLAPAPDGGNGYQNPTDPDAGCQAPNMLCGGVCIAVGSDPSNCGACGNACMGGDAVCLAGQCACTGQLQDYCAGVGCMDVSSDFNNCGACGNACDPNNDQACTGGVCIPNCCN